MLRLGRWSVCLLSGLAAGLVGCSSSRINTRSASLPPAGVERTVSTEHMLRVADILEQQQQTERAHEVYREILKREPGHRIATARLSAAGENVPGSSTANAGVESRNVSVSGTGRVEQEVDQDAPLTAPKAFPADVANKRVEEVDVPVLKEPVEQAAPAAPPAPKLVAPSSEPSRIEQPASKSPESLPQPALKPTVVSSPLQTTTVVDPNARLPELKAVPESKPRRVAKSASPGLRIMPRSKAGHYRPLKLQSRNAAGLSMEETSAPVSTQELAGMIAGLLHRDANIRSVAAFELGRLGRHGRRAIPQLERALRNEKTGFVQVRLAEAVARIDTENTPAFRLIVDALQAEDFKTRWEAVCAADVALRGAEAIRRDTVERLTEMLEDLNPKMRAMAALKIAQFGTEAAPALPALVNAAQQGDASLKQAANAALAVLRPKAFAPASED